jgi:hypothetical protein
MRYQAHPANGLSLYAMRLFVGANFRETQKAKFAEFPFHALR